MWVNSGIPWETPWGFGLRGVLYPGGMFYLGIYPKPPVILGVHTEGQVQGGVSVLRQVCENHVVSMWSVMVSCWSDHSETMTT